MQHDFSMTTFGESRKQILSHSLRGAPVHLLLIEGLLMWEFILLVLIVKYSIFLEENQVIINYDLKKELVPIQILFI